MVWFCLGWFTGAALMWGHFRWSRLIRTRAEWYVDPVIKAKHGDDPDPYGWDQYPSHDPSPEEPTLNRFGMVESERERIEREEL